MNELDELDELRAFREEVPAPGPERLADGRARLLRAAGTGRRGRRGRFAFGVPGGRLAAAACTAVAVAGAGGAAVAVLQDGSPPAPPAIAARPVGAQVFLERAATAAEARPERRPADTQWIYTKVFVGEADPSAPEDARWMEDWTRFDGLKNARYHRFPGKEPELRIDTNEYANTYGDDSEERTPAQWYDYLRGLPDAPSVLLDAAYRRFDEYKSEWEKKGDSGGSPQGRDQWVFSRLAGYLDGEPPLPPSSRAAIYRAIGRIPGVRLHKDARDALGRPGVAVVRAGGDGLRDEFIIAPGTYEYLGMRMVNTKEQWIPYPPGSVKDRPGPGMEPVLLPAGKVMMNRALQASAIVDEPGVRP